MVVAWHRPTRVIIHTKAITENVKKELARFTKRKRAICCSQSKWLRARSSPDSRSCTGWRCYWILCV